MRTHQNGSGVVRDVDGLLVAMAMLSHRETTETVAGVVVVWQPGVSRGSGEHRNDCVSTECERVRVCLCVCEPHFPGLSSSPP